MNPYHDKNNGQFTSGNNVGSKLNKMGFGPDRSGQNWTKDEQNNDHYQLTDAVKNVDKFLKFHGIQLSEEDKNDLEKYGTIPAETFENIFGDEDYLNDLVEEYNQSKTPDNRTQKEFDFDEGFERGMKGTDEY